LSEFDGSQKYDCRIEVQRTHPRGYQNRQ
jgi:hypothetical protein